MNAELKYLPLDDQEQTSPRSFCGCPHHHASVDYWAQRQVYQVQGAYVNVVDAIQVFHARGDCSSDASRVEVVEQDWDLALHGTPEAVIVQQKDRVVEKTTLSAANGEGPGESRIQTDVCYQTVQVTHFQTQAGAGFRGDLGLDPMLEKTS